MRAAALLAGVLAAVALSGCGGGEDQAAGVPPDEWTGQVCTALTSWLKDVVSRADELEREAGGLTSLEDGRDAVVEFLDFTVERTDELLTAVARAGRPAVEDGEAIARELRDNLEPFRAALTEAKERAESLPVDDPAAFEREATAIGRAVETTGSEVGKAFEGLEGKYDMAEISAVAEDQPACEDFEEQVGG